MIGIKNKLKLVYVDSKYCDYLRKYDSRVVYNFDKKQTRPFVGVLFEIDGCKYFAPLSSPKEKHKTMRNNIDFLKLDNGNLGVVNFNNMIPVKEDNIDIVDINNPEVTLKSYNKLLQNQIFWLNRNSDRLYIKSFNLYNKYKMDKLDNKIKGRCCNFILLEEKCLEYK